MPKKPKSIKSRKNTGDDDWLGDALNPALQTKLVGFTYRKASKRRGRKFDTIELRFSGGKVSISPDPVGKELELVAWFNADRP